MRYGSFSDKLMIDEILIEEIEGMYACDFWYTHSAVRPAPV